MEQIELKQWSSYLACKLQLKCSAIFRPNGNEKPILKGADATLTPDLLADITSGTFDSIGHFTPILRPLSDLTKEIEVDGEKFVPQEKLFENFDDLIFQSYQNVDGITDTYAVSYTIFEEPFTEFIFYCGGISRVRYEVVQKLFEWHFDVFGLIEKGLAIDINTLNK